MELKEFGAMTVDLLALSDWLAAAGITHVAIESTGEYWKPLDNTMEGDFTVFLVNAAHVQQVPPGRQTDKADARWLAKPMHDGLLRASFVPRSNSATGEIRRVTASSWCGGAQSGGPSGPRRARTGHHQAGRGGH
jgi:Transposase